VADAQANSRPAKKRRDRCRWRDGTGPANFCLPGGQEHGAQRSVPVLWKRSFCSSGPDRNGTVSCRGHRRPTLQPPPSLGPTRSTLVASPASTPALASASPSAPEFFQRPKYLEPGPSPRESPGNTKTGRRLGRRPLPGRMGFPTGPAREGGGDYRCVVRGGDTNLLPVAGMPPNTGGVPTAANRVGTAAQGRFWDQSPVGQFVEIGKLNVAGGRSQSAPSVST